jgi:hypothetical protein
VKTASGAVRSKKVDGLDLLSIILDGDLSPGEAAELPAVMHAARLGNTQPLLRLAQLHDVGSVMPSIDLSFGLYAATVCADGPLPWGPTTQPAERPALLRRPSLPRPRGPRLVRLVGGWVRERAPLHRVARPTVPRRSGRARCPTCR